MSAGVQRRLLGQCLRDLRLEAKLPVKRAAVALEWSEPKLWRIETGQTTMRGLDVQAMCAVYGAPPGLAPSLGRTGQTAKAGVLVAHPGRSCTRWLRRVREAGRAGV